jgi:hypothetical protein
VFAGLSNKLFLFLLKEVQLLYMLAFDGDSTIIFFVDRQLCLYSRLMVILAFVKKDHSDVFGFEYH